MGDQLIILVVDWETLVGWSIINVISHFSWLVWTFIYLCIFVKSSNNYFRCSCEYASGTWCFPTCTQWLSFLQCGSIFVHYIESHSENCLLLTCFSCFSSCTLMSDFLIYFGSCGCSESGGSKCLSNSLHSIHCTRLIVPRACF